MSFDKRFFSRDKLVDRAEKMTPADFERWMFKIDAPIFEDEFSRKVYRKLSDLTKITKDDLDEIVLNKDTGVRHMCHNCHYMNARINRLNERYVCSCGCSWPIEE